jgi:hypothetical protein
MSESENDITPLKQEGSSDKVKVAIHGINQRLYFALKKNTKLKKVMEMFANAVDEDVTKLKFQLDDRVLTANSTPSSIGLVDSDVIQVATISDGGDSY